MVKDAVKRRDSAAGSDTLVQQLGCVTWREDRIWETSLRT